MSEDCWPTPHDYWCGMKCPEICYHWLLLCWFKNSEKGSQEFWLVEMGEDQDRGGLWFYAPNPPRPYEKSISFKDWPATWGWK